MYYLFSKAICMLSFSLLLLWPCYVIRSQNLSDAITFTFGISPESKNSTRVINSDDPYTDLIGYGFDFRTFDNVIFQKDGFTASESVYFSVKLSEGDYKIEVTLGSEEITSETTVKAESRRVMLREIIVAKGQSVKKAFLLKVGTPQIDQADSILLKDREVSYLNWDNKLTIEFLGIPAVKSIEISPIYDKTTLFLAGDSTVADQDLEPWASWGQYITQFFNENIVIANYASSGASLSSFKASRRFAKILSLMKPRDYLFIEFGHNDQKQTGEGIGPWQSYSDLLEEFVRAVRKKEGIPVLLTPTQRRFFGPNGKLEPSHGDYPAAMRDVAKRLNVPLINLTEMTTWLYESWGDDESRKAFVQYPAHTFPGQTEALEDNTHFNNFGANEIALCVVQGIRNLDLKLGQFLKEGVPNYNPKVPSKASEWTLPMSKRFVPLKPDGN